MAHTLDPSKRYIMPTGFGPTKTEDVAHYGDVITVTVLYLTDKDALAALLPKPFEPADSPEVTVYCQNCREVGFMAGRGYNLVGVNLSAVFNGKKDTFEYPVNYAAVLWENDAFPIIHGREVLGAPKLYGDVPDIQRDGENWSFNCSVYGKRIIEAEVRNANALDRAMLEQIQNLARQSLWVAWKHIPQTNGTGADVSFPTLVEQELTMKEGWIGEGSHKFFEATWEEVLLTANVLQGLKTLVVKEYHPSFIMRSSVDMLVGESRKIE